MPHRHVFHIELADLQDEQGRRTMSVREQADALRDDHEWSDLHLDGKYIGRLRTLEIVGERVNMEAELRGDVGLPPYLQIGRFHAEMTGPQKALLEKFTIMARTQIDRSEDM
jgi:hypothetical protein